MAYVKASLRREQLVAAARRVLERDGVGGATLRAVAAEAGVPLGTLHYVFPSKELLLGAVIEVVTENIAEVLRAADTSGGLEHALRQAMENYWTQVVVADPQLQLLQYELALYALRTPGQENLARWQLEGYSRTVAAWCQEAASNAGEICAVPFDTLARVIVAAYLGLILQYLTDPDEPRSRRDLESVMDMVVHLAGARPARRKRPARTGQKRSA